MSAEALVVALAARGLDTSAGLELDEPLDDETWSRFHALAREHRLTGLLALAIAEGALPVTPDQDQDAGDVELRLATHVVTLELLLLQIADRFDEAAVDHRVLKGSAYAHTAYTVPEARPFADIDLLVRSRDLDRAGTILDGLGARRRVPELRPGFDRRFARTVTRATPGGHEVDLHRTLASGAFTFLVDADALFDRPATFELAGRPLPCFDPALSLLHAAVHLVLGGRPHLLTARDVAEHARHPGLDTAKVVDLARRWRLTAVVASALDSTRSRLGLGDAWASDLQAQLRPDAEEARLLATHPAELGRGGEQALHAVRYVPGTTAKLAFLFAQAWPARAHLRHRGLTRWAHLDGVRRRASRRS